MNPLLTESDIVFRAESRRKRLRFRLLGVGGLLLFAALCGFVSLLVR